MNKRGELDKMTTVHQVMYYAQDGDQMMQYLSIQTYNIIQTHYTKYNTKTEIGTDIASFGANSSVASRYTPVKPRWKVSHHTAHRGRAYSDVLRDIHLITYACHLT